MTAPPGYALSGLRVIDLGTMIAGPMVGSLLADFGADVIKIEQPKVGDPLRNWAPQKDGRSLWWKVAARNKRLVTLDVRKAAGSDVLRSLLKEADLLVENFRPGTLERWGLAPDSLLQEFPRLVIVRISGFGQTGPYRDRPGYGTIAEAMSGIPFFTGFPKMPPTLSAFPLADSVAGVFGALGALAAIYERDVVGSGRGQVVDVSLYEPLFRLVESQVIAYDQLGHVKQRIGNRMEEDVPRNAYRTRDDAWIVISASSPRTFERLARAVGREDLLNDPRFATNVSRVEHADELDSIIARWFSARTKEESLTTLLSADVVAGSVYDIRDIFCDPQYVARQDIVEVTDPDFGSVRMAAPVPVLSRTPGQVRFTGRDLGSDNEGIFADELGLADVDLQQLRSDGVI
jgi:crotonobetainyl-CoA:carnitine CoA-transferase CaiB-like acyl-CoA transferase